MTKTLLSLLLLSPLLLSLLAAPAFAATPALPKDLPAYGQDKPLPVPEIAKKTLENGMTVWVVPRMGVPRVDYLLAIKGAGLGADGADQQGFASTLAGLFSEGTAKHDSKAIAEIAQGYGGSVGAFASNDGLSVSAHAVASKAAPMIELLAEVARSPSFPEKEVALAKANALQGLKAAEAQPGFRAERAIAAAVYGDHPYARTQPTEASITAITRDQLQAAYDARVRPDRALLVITGRIDEAKAFELAESAFGDWKAEGEAPAAIPASKATAAPVFVHLDRPGSVQSSLRLGRPAIPATHADNVPLRLTSTLLGGGFSSRLMQNLREDKGYTYGAGVGMRAQAVGGSLVGSADVRNEVTGAAVSEFLAEFKKIGAEPVSARELDMNKRYVAGGYLISNQQQGAVAGTLASNWLVGLPPEYLGEYVPKIRAVTAQQIQEMGKKYFAPEQLSIVVVGDQAVVEQLKDYGKFETAK